jgi:serine protease inhibitor
VAEYKKLGAIYGTAHVADQRLFHFSIRTLSFSDSRIGLPAFRFPQLPDEKLPNLPQVQVPFGLEFSSTPLTQVTDAGLKRLKDLKTLATLNLFGTPVTDAGLKELKELKNLSTLELGQTQVTDAGLRELKDLKNLAALGLAGTQVTDEGLKELRDLKSLTALNLQGTQVSDEGLKELKDLKNLAALNLDNTQVTVGGLKDLRSALPKCQIAGQGRASAADIARAYGLTKLEPDAATVVKDSNSFALDLYGQLAQKDGNLFFSPYSISTALAMTYAGARGETAMQMANTLHFTLEQERLHPAFANLGKAIQGGDPRRKYQLQIANRLWGQKDFHFLPDFLQTTENHYGGGLKQVDFINAREEARNIINAWVLEQTKDKINELIQPGIFTVDTRLVLTNAIYFKAAWKRPFSTAKTQDGDFTLADGKKVKAKLMRGSNRTNYFKGEGFEALELPYEGFNPGGDQPELSMIVLLPNQADGLPAFEKMLTATRLKQWLARLSNPRLSDHMVDVTLPKFKLTSEFMLKDVLSQMGMPLAFDRLRADFSGMTTSDRLFISHVVHKTFVDVNEVGTEAAASTAVMMDRVSAPLPATFRADHPFVYLIRDNRTGSILFLGRVVNPT